MVSLKPGHIGRFLSRPQDENRLLKLHNYTGSTILAYQCKFVYFVVMVGGGGSGGGYQRTCSFERVRGSAQTIQRTHSVQGGVVRDPA